MYNNSLSVFKDGFFYLWKNIFLRECGDNNPSSKVKAFTIIFFLIWSLIFLSPIVSLLQLSNKNASNKTFYEKIANYGIFCHLLFWEGIKIKEGMVTYGFWAQ